MTERTAEDIHQDARIADLEHKVSHLLDKARELFDLEHRVQALEEALEPVNQVIALGHDLKQRHDELMAELKRFGLSLGSHT